MALEDDLVAAVMEMIKEMMSMSKEVLSMLKATIEIVTHHQEQLTFLQNKDSKGKEKYHEAIACVHTTNQKKGDKDPEQKDNREVEKKEKRKASQNSHQESKKGKWASKEACKRCGRNHEKKDCPWTTGSCFQCGEKGHLVANCPKKPTQEEQPQKTQGRLYTMAMEDADDVYMEVQDNDDNPLY